MSLWEDFVASLWAYLITAGIALFVAGPLFLLVRARRFLPMQRLRPVRWRGVAFWITFILFFLVPEITREALEELGFYDAMLEPAASSMRKTIWAAPLYTASWLAIMYWVLFAEFGTRPADFGMSRTRGLRYAILGGCVFLLLTPLILSLHAVTQWIQSDFFHGAPETHPLEALTKESLGFADWGLVFFLAIISAPVMEEVLCRGILQGWLRQASLIGHVSVVILTLLLGLAGFLISLPVKDAEPAKEATPGPLIFAALMACAYGYLAFTADRRSRAVLAIFGAAMVWSALHSLIWPSPVALLPLGIALGYLAYRTQSLLAGLVLHALFNTVACVGLVLRALGD